MNSGVEFPEVYGNIHDVLFMMFSCESNMFHHDYHVHSRAAEFPHWILT